MTTTILVTLVLVWLGTSVAVMAYALWLGLRPGDQIGLPEPLVIGSDACRITYYRVGNGPTLVLLHGLGASSYSWRYLIPLLSQDYELVAIDLPGFGASTKAPDLGYGLDAQIDRLDRCIRSLNIQPMAIIGSSLGGLLALGLAKKDPTYYCRIIALAPAALGALFRLPLARFRQKGRYLKLFINRFTMPFVAGLVIGRPGPLNRDSMKNYLAPYRDPQLFHTFFASFEAMSDPRLPQFFSDLKIPILVLWGERDLQVSWRAIEALREVLPAAEIKRLPKLAHHPHESHPEIVANEIRLWLNRNN